MRKDYEEMKDVGPRTVSPEYSVFPKRPTPTQDSSGSLVKLSTNYFRMSAKPSNYVYVYAISFEPTIPNDNTPLRKRVIRGLREILEPNFKKFICTGGNLFTTYDAGPSPIVQPTAEGGIKYVVTLTKAHVISLEDILHPDKDTAKAQTANTFFNILIKSLLSALNMVPVGRTGKYLIPEEASAVHDHNIQIWPGYKTSVRLCEAGLLIEIDYTSRILSKSNAFSVIRDIKANSRNYQQDVKEYFKDRSVIAWYGNKVNYIISDVVFDLTPATHKFSSPEGETNIVNYMRSKYGIAIKYPDQPLLLHLKKPRGTEVVEKIYLVPELVGLTGLPDDMRNDFRAMRDVAVYTKLNPDQRTEKMEKLLHLFNRMDINHSRREGEALNKRPQEQPGEILKRWGFSIDPTPIQVHGRKLKPVTISLGGGKTMEVPYNGQFFFKQAIVNPLTLDKWILVHDRNGGRMSEKFVDTLYEASKTFGINVDYPEYIEAHNSKAEGFIEAIQNATSKVPEPQVVLCILSRNSVNEYHKIKRWAITQQTPFLTQMVKLDTLERAKNMMPICSKIILQINTKRNGELWRVSTPKEVPRKSMMVGLDVSREKGTTYLGLSSSYDPWLAKYYTQIVKLDDKAEISGLVGNLLSKALVKFYKETKNSFLPELIVIYRDGVGDSQKHEVFQSEVESIFNMMAAKFENYKPKLLFAVINKKVHTRFFKKDTGTSGGRGYGGRGRGRGGFRGGAEERHDLVNPDSGTVIHSDIVNDKIYEFLIMPQYVNEGTGTPVRVHVIYDTSGLSLNVFEDLTNSLCYGYDNWQGAVRAPAPCKYAFTHAKLAAKYTRAIPEESLLSRKYFL